MGARVCLLRIFSSKKKIKDQDNRSDNPVPPYRPGVAVAMVPPCCAGRRTWRAGWRGAAVLTVSEEDVGGAVLRGRRVLEVVDEGAHGLRRGEKGGAESRSGSKGVHPGPGYIPEGFRAACTTQRGAFPV